jgi:hypothetical protein
MLTELTIKNAKAKDKDYKLSDSEGLYLYVTKFGHRSWRMKYRFAGKERRLVLGSYPEVPLKLARDRKIAARKLLSEGRDPGLEARKAKVARTVASGNTFEALARGWYDLQESRWTPIHAGDVIGSLEKEVFPWIGKLPIREIDEPLVLSVLRKIERRGAIETAHRVRQRISAVFVHAIAEGAAARDPAGVVTKALKPVPRARKRPALISIEALHDMIRKTEAEPASPLTKLASRFLALTAQRPGMIRALPWTEIENVNWSNEEPCPDALWRVPAARMKLMLELKHDDGFEHLVPLVRRSGGRTPRGACAHRTRAADIPEQPQRTSADEREYVELFLQPLRLSGPACAAWLASIVLDHHERVGRARGHAGGSPCHRFDAGAHP